MHQLIIHRVWRILSIRRKNSKFRQNRVSNVNFSPRITKTHCISKILQTLYMFSQCTIIGLHSGWNWQYIPDFVESRYFFLPAWPANRHSAALDFPEHTTGTYLIRFLWHFLKKQCFWKVGMAGIKQLPRPSKITSFSGNLNGEALLKVSFKNIGWFQKYKALKWKIIF